MGNILSFINDQPQKYKRNLFLDTNSFVMSSMVYQGENTLVIESKIQDGCRILLNRSDLLQLQDLECSIFEVIEKKNDIIKPFVMNQIEQISSYLKSTYVLQEPRKIEDMKKHMRNISNDYSALIVFDADYTFTELISNNCNNFISQLKLYASEHIIQRWIKKLENFKV